MSEHYMFPVPKGFKPMEAWRCHMEGVAMLRLPPEDEPDPNGGGWAVMLVRDEKPVRVLSPQAARHVLTDGFGGSIHGEKRRSG